MSRVLMHIEKEAKEILHDIKLNEKWDDGTRITSQSDAIYWMRNKGIKPKEPVTPPRKHKPISVMSSRTKIRSIPPLELPADMAERIRRRGGVMVVPQDTEIKEIKNMEENKEREENGVDKDNPDRFYIKPSKVVLKEPEPKEEKEEEKEEEVDPLTSMMPKLPPRYIEPAHGVIRTISKSVRDEK